MRNATALVIPLNDEPAVEPMRDETDIDSCDQVYAAEHQDDDIPSDTNIYDLMDDGMLCRSPMGHLFLNGLCVHCGDPVRGSRRFSCGPV